MRNTHCRLRIKSTGGILLNALITREYNILREQLRAWCQAGRGPQKEIAEALGVSKQLVSGWAIGSPNHVFERVASNPSFPQKAAQGEVLRHLVHNGDEAALYLTDHNFPSVMTSIHSCEKRCAA